MVRKGDKETRNSWRAGRNQKPRELEKGGGKQGQILQMVNKMDLKKVHWICQILEGSLATVDRGSLSV